jgi:ABC-type dipeptide/oligopeptide/nickel transport system permease subunit
LHSGFESAFRHLRALRTLTRSAKLIYARTVRGNALAEKKKEYVDAARCMAFGPSRIVFRHISASHYAA